jgi:transcription antitermination factor NusG
MELPSYNIHNEQHWFALYTKPKNEFKAESLFNSLGIKCYLPVFSSVKQWSDRKKKITEPVIRGYVFIFADEKERLTALHQSMIIRCVSDHGKPARIPDWQIDNLKIILDHKSVINVIEGITPGRKIEILEGPFAGLRGKIVNADNIKMIAVSIDLLNRSVIAHLPKDSKMKILKDEQQNAYTN